MESYGEIETSVPVNLAQQGGGPLYGHNDAYEGGRQVGQIAAYVMIGTIVLWGVFKYGAKLFKK